MTTATLTKSVKVAKLGTPKKEVELEVATTVEDVLARAGLTGSNYEPMLNGSPCKLSDTVEPGDVVVLAPQIRGGGCG
jgi:sulfur carrier protein ThiS